MNHRQSTIESDFNLGREVENTMECVMAGRTSGARRGTAAQRCAQARQPLRHRAPRIPDLVLLSCRTRASPKLHRGKTFPPSLFQRARTSCRRYEGVAGGSIKGEHVVSLVRAKGIWVGIPVRARRLATAPTAARRAATGGSSLHLMA